MESIKPSNSYAARPAGTGEYHDGSSHFKICYVDITGRDNPERYEWGLCGQSPESVPEALRQARVEGIGFVISFPHITKVFRFAPAAEIIMHVRAYKTGDFSEVDLQREGGYLEFACLAEAIIAADEYLLWAKTESVEQYLGLWSDWQPAEIIDHTKMLKYFTEER